MIIARPNIDQLILNTPQVLQEARQWIRWKYTKDDKKPPVGATGRKMDCTNPAAWMRFSDALTAAAADHDRISGVGVALPKAAMEGYNNVVPLLAFDMDWKHCPNGQTGKFPHHFTEVVNGLDSYTEWSPSGKGAHVLILATLPIKEGVRTHTFSDGSEVSLMQHSVYVTFTGNKLAESGRTIEDRQSLVDTLFEEWFPETAVTGALDAIAVSDEDDAGISAVEKIVLGTCVSDEDIERLIKGVSRTPDQIRRMAATWEMRRTPGVPNAEFEFKGNHSVSKYLKTIVQEVLFLAPALGWNDLEQTAANFAVTFARRNGIPADRITPARLRAWLNSARKYQRSLQSTRATSIQSAFTNPSINSTCEENIGHITPTTTVQCSLSCVLPERCTESSQPAGTVAFNPKSNNLAGNTCLEPESVTNRRHKAASQGAIRTAVSRRKGWVPLKTLCSEFPGKSPKAILMALKRLVKCGELEHKDGRSGKYRVKRERKQAGPRKRRPRPFPVTKDGSPRKTISRSELIGRGWSKELIDGLLPTKNKDFVVQLIRLSDSNQTSIQARYYWIGRVKEMEAQPWFEEKRFDLRRRLARVASRPPVPEPAHMPSPIQPPRRPIQKATELNAVPDADSQSACA